MAMMTALHADSNRQVMEAMDRAREQSELHLHRVEATLTLRQDQLGRDLAEGLVATQVGLHAHVEAVQAEQQQQQLLSILE